MKYWKLLFLTLTLNSCIEKDPVQPQKNKTELKAMQRALFKNFVCLDTFVKIAKQINYIDYSDDSQKDHIKHLDFICNCSKTNLDDQKDSIFEILQKPLKDILSEQNPGIQEGLKSIASQDPDYDNSILKFLDVKQKDEVVPVLAGAIKNYIKTSEKFFRKIQRKIAKYKDSIHLKKIENSADAFIKLFGFLQKLCKNYSDATENLNDEQLISCFFSNFLGQFFNIYYENIYRTRDDENGIRKSDLSFIHALMG